MSCLDRRAEIHALVDGELAPELRASLEAHLEACEACRTLVADLGRIRRAARDLGPVPPPERVWIRLSARIVEEDSGRSHEPVPRGFGRWGIDRWLGAAAAVVLAAGALWFGFGREAEPVRFAPQATPGVTELRIAEVRYTRAIAELEPLAVDQTARLDDLTAGTLRQNLDLIDQAIVANREMLRAEPGNEVAQETLLEALRRKVGLLQDILSLVQGLLAGDQFEVARAIESVDQATEPRAGQ